MSMGKVSYKISFCIICMNRTHHLIQTLIRNIEDNGDYEDFEIILLDYNSQDGMEQWVKENLTGYLTSGKVIYYKTPDPQTFNHSHAKNVAFKLATGDIVCNINADNFTGLRFASYVNDSFNNNPEKVLTPISLSPQNQPVKPPRDIMGKVCVKKSDFLKVNGFDESMTMYGYEDYDFINRLEMVNIQREPIADASFWGFISHENEERYSESKVTDQFLSLYINYSNDSTSLILLLFKDNRYELRTLTDTFSKYSDSFIESYSKKDDRYMFSDYEAYSYGAWNNGKDAEIIYLHCRGGGEYILNKIAGDNCYKLSTAQGELVFYKISDTNIINDISIFRNSFSNREIMKNNLINGIVTVNPEGFGKARLFKNFDKTLSIQI
jgi:glycosyltransferase involved in cell wall biosynthesis